MAEQQRERDNYQTSEVSEQWHLSGDVLGMMLTSFTFVLLYLQFVAGFGAVFFFEETLEIQAK